MRRWSRLFGLARATVSSHLARAGGIPAQGSPAPRALPGFEEREEISRGIARGRSARAIAHTLGRSHTTIAREINRCSRRRRYRALAAEREASRRARRPRPTKFELSPELRRVVEGRLQKDHSPQQIAGWLGLQSPENEAMRVSHETIYPRPLRPGAGDAQARAHQAPEDGARAALCPLAVVKGPGPRQAQRDGDDLRARARRRSRTEPSPAAGRATS